MDIKAVFNKITEGIFWKVFIKMKKHSDDIILERRKNFWTQDFVDRMNGRNTLTDEQIKAVKEFYGRYVDESKINTLFHNFYNDTKGDFDVRYIPVDLYFCYIDPYFNNHQKAEYIDNKCLYSRLFRDAPHPEIVLNCVNNVWTDEDFRFVSEEDIDRIVGSCDELIVKQAKDTQGGKNIYFVSGENIVSEFRDACKKINSDIVVQKIIKQHSVLNSINATSVNTIRILTMLNKNDVKIYSTIIRMGVDGSRVDNASSGGLTCGIDSEGRLKKYAYNLNGERFENHPTSGISFNSVVIPGFDKACDLCRRLHPSMSDFRLISWDICINEEGEPILIEANLCYGGINVHQISNGPVFGDDTEKILEEVFSKK